MTKTIEELKADVEKAWATYADAADAAADAAWADAWNELAELEGK